MSRRLIFDTEHNLNLLHEELLVEFPDWRGTPTEEGFRNPLLRVEHDVQGRVVLRVPDDADEAAVTAVVGAHDPGESSSQAAERRRRDTVDKIRQDAGDNPNRPVTVREMAALLGTR